MLPLLLNIKGVYSYQKKQTINFQELTDAGLFGVFGAVGSGKSTILEAIGFVLYNQTERLDARDKRAYNMLNLKSNEAEIEFEFLNYQERKFKFCAEWSRKLTRYDEVSTVNGKTKSGFHLVRLRQNQFLVYPMKISGEPLLFLKENSKSFSI
jgi:exonuclease SbcC